MNIFIYTISNSSTGMVPDHEQTLCHVYLLQDSESDPGMIFLLGTPAEVHTCLGLPAVQNLAPPLQQGKILRII